MKWKSLLAMAMLWVGVLMNWNWIWGVLFLWWTIPALYSGEVFVVEPIERKSHPVFFWLVIGTWIFLSLYLIYVDVALLF